MKKRNRRLLAVLCAVVTAAGIAAPAMTPVYAAQNEVTNEEVNAEVMSAGNTKDDVDDSGNADEQEDVYSLNISLWMVVRHGIMQMKKAKWIRITSV